MVKENGNAKVGWGEKSQVKDTLKRIENWKKKQRTRKNQSLRLSGKRRGEKSEGL